MYALLLLSYGAPEREDEVRPFLARLFQHARVSTEHVDAAAEKYHEFARKTGGYSPLNRECRALIEGIRRELSGSVRDSNRLTVFPEYSPETSCRQAPNRTALKGDASRQYAANACSIFWANLFWRPLLEDVLVEMAQQGVQNVVCFITSAFDSHASRGRYVEALEAARKNVGKNTPAIAVPEITLLPPPFEERLFLEAQADRLLETLAWAALESWDAANDDIQVIFTAHSIPKADAENSKYVEQLSETCKKVAELCGLRRADWELAWQSRGLRALPGEWLEPDVSSRVEELAQTGCRSVVVVPIGFFCENMETANDLDLELGEWCRRRGLRFYRAKTVGATPKICRMIGEMLTNVTPAPDQVEGRLRRGARHRII